jgi:hypothetical protein
MKLTLSFLGLLLMTIDPAPAWADASAMSVHGILLHPESALIPPPQRFTGERSKNMKDSAFPALVIEAKPLSFLDPQILIEKDVLGAHFVSALWKGDSEMVPHQRNVLIVESDYAVIVDYLYGGGDKEVAVDRLLNVDCLPASSQPSIDSEGGGWLSPTSDPGKSFRIQSLTPAMVTLTSGFLGTGVTLSSRSKFPVPVTSVMLAWKGGKSPKVDYVKAVNPMVVKLKVTFPDGRIDEIAMAWEARSLHIGKSEFNGWSALLRHEGQDSGITARESSIEIK